MKQLYAGKALLGLILASSLLATCKRDPVPPKEPGLYLYEEKYAPGSKTVYTPDVSGRIGTMVDYDKTGAQMQSTSFTYDASGNLIRSLRISGEKEKSMVEYFYSGGKLSGAKDFYDADYNGTFELVGNSTYTVDPSGRLIGKQRHRDGSSSEIISEETYEYDSRGNLTRITKYGIFNGNKTLNGTIEMTYDNKRNPYSTFRPPLILIWETTVNNELTLANKDANGKVWTSRTSTYEYNSEGLPTKKTTNVDNTDTFDILYTYKKQ